MATMTSPALDRAKAAGLTDNHIQRLTGIATDYPANAFVQYLRVLDQMWGSGKEALTQHETNFTAISLAALSEVNRILHGTTPDVEHDVLMSTAASAVFLGKDKEQQDEEMILATRHIMDTKYGADKSKWNSLNLMYGANLVTEAQNTIERMRATKNLLDARIAEAQRA